MTVGFRKVSQPAIDNVTEVVHITDETMNARRDKLSALMKSEGFSSIIIYADKEHGSNFEFLTGFIPRFEEGLIIYNADQTSTLILGNENFNKVKYSRTASEGIKCTLFSLPNQPINHVDEMKSILKDAQIDQSQQIGVVGWKMLPGMTHQYDIPQFIVEALKEVVPSEKLVNGTYLLTDPTIGVRTTNNANEIAHFEYGASLASDAILKAMNALEEGVTEQEAGELLQAKGFFPTVVTISAFGDRFIGANLYPTSRKLSSGDKTTLTISYRGGLSSRNGYSVSNLEELENAAKGYYAEAVVPYFEAYNYWLSNLSIGKNGGEFYKEFKSFYPQEKYGWELNPGHLTSNEEWMSSPFYENSDATVKSGMIFQVDFIPIQKGFNGVSAESTVAIADEKLRNEIKSAYPELWSRIVARREYMKNELGIELNEDLLPLASTLGYYRPFMLDKETALVIES